ncbi:hypothetical protein CRG49_006685 [Neisseria sp. N95_16]|uniref:Phage coat protein n=1 Tax=Neisseria brasiliensis TaxID=2666100 RepID=A0A7X2KZ47_9NEIS|nr:MULTISPECIES: hypothetical protein [Neisseria]MRN39301.1 hypothetical protein [Neisseria brasiliensis]PJO09599.1 hypothetical protein CRG49_006685 [Neisseria sp. N95_16]
MKFMNLARTYGAKVVLAVGLSSASALALANDGSSGYSWSQVGTQIAQTVSSLTAVIGSVGMSLITVAGVMLGFGILFGFIRRGR